MYTAPNEVKEYAQKLIAGEEGMEWPSDAEIRKNVTEKVDYAVNAEKVFDSPAALCGDGCIRACLAHLEKQGKLKKKFHKMFR